MECNSNHILPSYCHLPVSCRSLVDWRGSLGSYKPQIFKIIIIIIVIVTNTYLSLRVFGFYILMYLYVPIVKCKSFDIKQKNTILVIAIMVLDK